MEEYFPMTIISYSTGIRNLIFHILPGKTNSMAQNFNSNGNVQAGASHNFQLNNPNLNEFGQAATNSSRERLRTTTDGINYS